MNRPAGPVNSPRTGFAAKAKDLAIGVLFAAVLLIPKILGVRNSPRAMLLFRVALGLAGASLVILPISLWSSWFLPVLGLLLFLAAVLIPAPRADRSVDDTARELGALVVVNGGKYQPGNGSPCEVRLFVGAERIWALDPAFRPILVIPIAEIRSVRVSPGAGSASLRVEWQDHAAEFAYTGFFAAHLAEVAENTLRGVIPAALPILDQPPRKRAASA